MNTSIRSASAIAEDAIDSLRGTRETLQQLGALFNSLKKSTPGHSDASSLAALGALVAIDQANSVDCLIEDWHAELNASDVATQSAEAENVLFAAGGDQ